MPGSGKGAKGKKLTKAEKDRMKKEEDEKKAKEEGDGEEDEEEARLKAEREEQEKKDREKNEAEEKRRLENEASGENRTSNIKRSSIMTQVVDTKSTTDSTAELRLPSASLPARSNLRDDEQSFRSSRSGAGMAHLPAQKLNSGVTRDTKGIPNSNFPESSTQDFDFKSITPSALDVSSFWNPEEGLLYGHAPNGDELPVMKSMNTPDEVTALEHVHEEEEDERVQQKIAEMLKRMGIRWVEKYLASKERKRRKGQLAELDQIWEENRNTLALEKAERQKAAKWERYMLCDGSPDPTIQGEINTYMNLWKEDKTSNGIQNVLKESRLALSLIDELNTIKAEASTNNVTPEDVVRYGDTIKELQVMLHDKLELASHDLLMKATELADSETSNLQQTIANDMITLCLWGNLSKNPRIKHIAFDKKGYTFEIPKVLCLSDCAVRVLFTKYDHLSPRCNSYTPRQKKVEEEPAENEQKEDEETKPEEEGEAKEGEEDGENNEERPELVKEDTEDVMAALRDLEGDGETEEKKEEQPEEEVLEEEYDIPTPEPVEWEDFEGDDDAVDLRANHIMGDIFHFNLLVMPPQPKIVRDWTIVQVEEPPRLKYMEYMADSAVPTSAKSKDDKDKEHPDEEGKKREERPPIGVTIRLPEEVYFCEEPQVVRWNEETSQWRLDGFSDHGFNEENRILSFRTTHFGTMALVQDAHINMPFQSWEIRPHKANSAIFTVIAAIIEVEIEIRDGECCLNVPEERKELNHLRDLWLPPQEFIKRMRAAGMNIFPAEDSAKYVSVQNKNLITEERLYQQMAMTASSMAFSWSKWNSEVKDSTKIVVQGTEHLVDEPLLEEDWSLFLVNKKRVTKLRMTEFDEKFSEDHAEGTEFHADMYHMAMEIMSQEGQNRVNDTNYQFTDCVYQLLSAVKPVTYS